MFFEEIVAKRFLMRELKEETRAILHLFPELFTQA